VHWWVLGQVIPLLVHIPLGNVTIRTLKNVCVKVRKISYPKLPS
jgi:hypothetical protein